MENLRFLTQEEFDKIPDIYAQDGKGLNATAFVKLFTPDSSFTWYITEIDKNDKVSCFGLVHNGCEFELGYFNLEELFQIRGGLGLPIEKDISFTESTLEEIKKRH
jgi:hypothetical protein